MIERKEYFNMLENFKDKHIIKVVTGIRRCGKSTLLEMFREKLIKSGVDKKQIIYLNFEEFGLDELRNPKKLYDYIMNNIDLEKKNYIFLDEVQIVEDFPRVVDGLFLKKNLDIYITGSNAYMLSSKIATFLTGRYIEIKMLPLSFKEFVLAKGKKDNLNKLYLDYIKESSFPFCLDLNGDMKQIYAYLEGVYNTIIFKDVVFRNNFSSNMMLESLVKFVFDNIGSRVSTKKIADTLMSNGRKVDVKTIEKYMTALLDSFIIYRVNRYDIKGKEYLKTLEKYYVADVGLRYMLLGDKGSDRGHILENIVFLELLRRYKKVYIGKLDDLEVDFVCEDEKGYLTYYQVAETVRDENTLKRELEPLQNINDHYLKVILTLDEDLDCDYNGIRKINALNWLLEE